MRTIFFYITIAIVLIINFLVILNNGIDLKYLIEPFENGDNILELKRIVENKLSQNNYILLFDSVMLILIAFLKVKKK